MTISQATLPEQEFLDALYSVTKQAVTAYPNDRQRIQRAVGLILQHHVQLLDNGEADVTSSDGQTVYRTNGKCQCRDFQQGHIHCKHRYSRTILRKVHGLLATNPWTMTHSVERRDAEAAKGSFVALVCSPEYRMRSGGMFEKTAGR